MGEFKLIHSACVLFMGVHVCWCVSRGSGGSSVQHVPGRFVITSVRSGREREKTRKKVREEQRQMEEYRRVG